MGKKCGTFINSWIKREYSNEMNTYKDLFDTWEYLHTKSSQIKTGLNMQITVLQCMIGWLTHKVYKDLGIAECTEIYLNGQNII